MSTVKKLQKVISAVDRLSAHTGESMLSAFCRIIRYRMQTGYGVDMFLGYRVFNKQPEEWASFVGKRELCQLLMQVNDTQAFGVLDNKIKFYLHCAAADIPTSEVVLVTGMESSYSQLPCAQDVYSFVSLAANLAEGRYIAKPSYGSYGEGLFSLQYTNGVFHDLASGAEYAPEELGERLLSAAPEYLFQKTLVPHADLLPIMPPPACGMVRVVTYLTKNGDVRIPYTFVKAPVKGQVADNFMHGETGNLVLGIDTESGKAMKCFGPGGDGMLTTFTQHPDTDALFADVAIPGWERVCALAAKSARAFPDVRFIGWDIAVTSEGPLVLEGNPMFDPDFPQIALERGIRQEIEEMMQQ